MYQEFFDSFPAGTIRIMEPMKNHTSFKIGGPADIMVLPESVDMLKEAIQICVSNRLPYFVFGLGSNLLVSDRGFRGIAIKIGSNLNEVKISGVKIYAQAGIRLSELARKASADSLSGLEFAEGIPGSLGGAIFMNAGAYGGETSDVADSVLVLTRDGEIKTINREALDFGYRHSRVQDENDVVLSATYALVPGDGDVIQAKMDDLNAKRAAKQPLDLPSCGSVFKRPEGYFAGKLIHDAGLQGHQVGGAQVSTKHAGFIVNVDHATATDYLNLIHHVQAVVFKKFNVHLETEVRIIGESVTQD